MPDSGCDPRNQGLWIEGEAGWRILAHDWAATPLGDAAGWPQALKTVVEVVLGSSRPMFVAWGPERTLIYNQAYAAVLANKHPALGRDLLAVWGEIRADLEPLVARAYAGEATSMEGLPLLMERKGYSEPTYWDYAYTPVRDAGGAGGAGGGLLCACHEVTEHVVMLRDRAFRLVLEDRLRSIDCPDAMTAAAAGMLRQHLGASRIAYAEDAGDEAHQTVTMDANDAVPSIKGTYRLTDYGDDLLREMQAGRTVIHTDVVSDPDLTEVEKIAHANLNIGATANIPLVRAGRVDTGPAVALSLVLHELATNASKYGALSEVAGSIAVDWRAAGDQRVELTWQERAGPTVAQPDVKGFGSRLIAAAERQLGWPVELRFDPAGVTCRMSVALREAAPES